MKKTLIKHISFTILALLLTSCSTPKVVTKTQTKVVKDTVFITKTIENDTVKMAHLRKYEVVQDSLASTMQNSRVRFLVLHYTNADNELSFEILSGKKGIQVSSHYLVNDKNDKKIHILVNEERRAWHAGRSHWRNRDNINDTSIGIEIVYPGFTETGGVQTYPEYPEYQFRKVAELCKDILKRYPTIDPTNVIAHSDVAPQRKYDPGPMFPWQRLHDEYGVGAWYDSYAKKVYLDKFDYAKKEDSEFIKSVQKDLETYGYKIEITGAWDAQTKRVIQKFQHHFRPNNYDGELDGETWAILQALNVKYRN